MAKTSLKVQVPYSKLLVKAQLTEDRWWTQKAVDFLQAPLGPHGANKVQLLTLGEKTAHHAIVVGRTGSGKSNLMHVIITSLGLAYPPEELELYLIDFKQGVEFKPYALAALPDAKVIAIESEREFGISVLRGLDAELTRRGELFRTNNLNNIADYRHKVGMLPRILLMVDEFQEFFSHEDAISSQARLILIAWCGKAARRVFTSCWARKRSKAHQTFHTTSLAKWVSESRCNAARQMPDK